MAVGANIPDLAALYDQLKNSMQDADTMINQLDGRLTQANEEWQSKGAHEFNDAWHNGFKPSLTKLCQALATAGTDVAFQHNKMAEGAKEADQHPHLTPRAVPPLTRSIARRRRGGSYPGPSPSSCPGGVADDCRRLVPGGFRNAPPSAVHRA